MYPTSIDGKPSAGGFRMPHQTVRVFRTGFGRSVREFEYALTPCRETSVFRQGEASHQHPTPRDDDALTPLIWTTSNLYGRFDLDMDARMALAWRIWRLVTRVLALPLLAQMLQQPGRERVRSNAHSYRNREPRVGNCPRPPGLQGPNWPSGMPRRLICGR